MMHFKDGNVSELSVSDFLALLKERQVLKIQVECAQDEVGSLRLRLVSANKGWDEALDMLEVTQDMYEQAAARAQCAFDEAHLQRNRADRLEAIIEVMNESLMKLVDDSNSTLYNDREVNI